MTFALCWARSGGVSPLQLVLEPPASDTLVQMSQTTPLGASNSEPQVSVSYSVPRWSPAWAVPEVPVPESRLHDIAIEYLRAVLLAWAERERRDVEIARNLGIHWFEPERRAGFDPDLCLLEPKPPDVESIGSLRLWEPGHVPPWLAIEIVSPGHPYKDYVDTPDRCAAAGVGELWVYDPQLKGPKRLGGPYLLQIWSRDTHGSLVRSHAGDGPAYSPVMNAWLHPIASKNASEAKLRLSDARDADVFWPTLRETHERQRLESERQTAELLRRIAELESERASREG